MAFSCIAEVDKNHSYTSYFTYNSLITNLSVQNSTNFYGAGWSPRFYSAGSIQGYPTPINSTVGTTPGTSVAITKLSRNSIYYPEAPIGKNKFITSCSAVFSHRKLNNANIFGYQSQFFVVDRLWEAIVLCNTNIATSISPTPLPPRDIYGSSNGFNTFVLLEQYDEASSSLQFVGNVAVNISYTDAYGVSNTYSFNLCQSSGTFFPGWCTFVPALVNVQSITGVSFSTNSSFSNTMCISINREICRVNAVAPASEYDVTNNYGIASAKIGYQNGIDGKVYPNSSIYIIGPSDTSSISGTITFSDL